MMFWDVSHVVEDGVKGMGTVPVRAFAVG